MIGTGGKRVRGGRRLTLLLVACALLFRIAVPAGWMPQASARGISIGWCSGIDHALPPEASALVAKALGGAKAPKHKPSGDQPCAFAAAAQPVAAADPIPPVIAPRAALETPRPLFIPLPGRGLAAPPPLATGPPRSA